METTTYPPGPVGVIPGWCHASAYCAPLRFIQNTARKFPGIAHIRLGRRHDYLVSGRTYVRDVLFAPDCDLRRGFHSNLRALMGRGLLRSQGRLHRQQRKLIAPMLGSNAIDECAVNITDRCLEALQKWKPDDARDLADDMSVLAFAIIADVVLGKNTDPGVGLRPALDAATRMTGRYGYVLSFLGLANGQQTHIQQVDKFIFGEISKAQRSPSPTRSVLGELCRQQTSPDGSLRYSNRQIRDEIMTLLIAGHETTATALTWAWYLLSENRSAEFRLHEELARVLGGRTPRIPDLPQLRYTHAVLSETMRLYPPVWLLLRHPVRPWQLGSYTIPTGSSIWVSPYLAHRDPDNFPSPERFDPGRWIRRRRPVPREIYFPFGAGAHLCVGESLAWTEMMLILATIAQKWMLRVQEGHRVSSMPVVTLKPRYGMMMNLSPRV